MGRGWGLKDMWAQLRSWCVPAASYALVQMVLIATQHKQQGEGETCSSCRGQGWGSLTAGSGCHGGSLCVAAVLESQLGRMGRPERVYGSPEG